MKIEVKEEERKNLMKYLIYLICSAIACVNIVLRYRDQRLNADREGIRQLTRAVGTLTAVVFGIIFLGNFVSSDFLLLLDLIVIMFTAKFEAELIMRFIHWLEKDNF